MAPPRTAILSTAYLWTALAASLARAVYSSESLSDGAAPSHRPDHPFLSVVHPPNADCPTLARVDDLAPDLPGYFLPTTCRLGVVTVGMPRSGSTLQNKLVAKYFDAVLEAQRNRSRAAEGAGRMRYSYWDLHKHALQHLPAREIRSHVEKRNSALMQCGSGDVFVAKSHEYKPQLFGLCRRTVVISTVRDMASSAESFLSAGWMSDAVRMPGEHAADASRMMGELTTCFLEASINRHRCWRENAPAWLEATFEELTSRPEDFLRKFLAWAEWEVADLAESDRAIRIAVDEIAGHEANKDNPASGVFYQRGANPMMDSALDQAMGSPLVREFQAEYKF